MKSIFSLFACAAALLFSSTYRSAAEESGEVYELRIYVCEEGKLPDLLKRFREHTVALFEKHGMTNIGYWVPVDEEHGASNTLMYLLKHKSRAAAKASFDAFLKDPEWIAARRASEENGRIIAGAPESIFLKVTDYSPEVKVAVEDPERMFELRMYETPPGKLDALNTRFREHTMKLFSKHGMKHIGYWEPIDPDKGAGEMLVYILSHESKEAGQASFTAFRADPDWIEAKGASEKDGALTLPQPDGVKSIYMKATDFSPMR